MLFHVYGGNGIYQWIAMLAVLAGLILLNEFARRTKFGGLVMFGIIPLALTVYFIVIAVCAGQGIDWAVNNQTHLYMNGWFHYAKLYAALAGCIGFMMIKYEWGIGKKQWFRAFPFVIVAINILIAVASDFESAINGWYSWCVNTDASDSDKQLAKDFLNWLYTSETGADYLTNKFGFIPEVDGMEADNLDPLSQAVSDAIAEGNIIPWTFNEEWPAGIITTYLVQNAEEYFSSDMTTDEFLKALNDSFVTAANE